jgi:hypothetical protein
VFLDHGLGGSVMDFFQLVALEWPNLCSAAEEKIALLDSRRLGDHAHGHRVGEFLDQISSDRRLEYPGLCLRFSPLEAEALLQPPAEAFVHHHPQVFRRIDENHPQTPGERVPKPRFAGPREA